MNAWLARISSTKPTRRNSPHDLDGTSDNQHLAIGSAAVLNAWVARFEQASFRLARIR